MYSYLEIESIFQNIHSKEEWEAVIRIFGWLSTYFPGEVYPSENHRNHFVDISTKRFRELCS